MNASQHSSSISQKKFGNIKVTWLIDEFYFEITKKEWVIRSPEFIVRGFEETKFTMMLQAQNIVTNEILTFCLKRSLFDEGPEIVWINMRLFYSLSDQEYAHPVEKLFHLKRGSENKTLLKGFVTERITTQDVSLQILCHILVYSKDMTEKFKECSDVGLELLSKNMLRLYNSGKNSDVILVVQNNIIQAHLSVLSARLFKSKILSHLIATGTKLEGHIIIEIPNVDYNAMNKTLSYVYSGDLKHVLGEPSHAIHECANLFNIPLVKALYRPDTVTFKSSINIETFTFVVLIPNIARVYDNPHLTILPQEIPFRVTSQRHGNSNLNYSSQCIGKISAHEIVSGNINIAVVDKDGTCLFAFRFSRCKEGKSFKFCEFIKPTSPETNSVHDLMGITFTLKTASGSRYSRKIKGSTDINTYFDDDFAFKYLSKDLDDLFLIGAGLSDIIISNNLAYFPVHKCIVASRSSFFSELINDKGMDNIIITNIESHILHFVLHYLYSGYVPATTADLVIKMYNVAAKIELPLLKGICSSRLKELIDTDTTLRCRVMKVAEENNDKDLKNLCID